MRLNIKIIFLICVSIVIFPLSLSARGAGTSAASFLKIDIGARPAGMGGAFCGIADDVNTIQYNPAGLIQLQQKEIGATHNEWIEGIRSEFLGYAHPLNENWVCGLTLNYLYVGDDLIERDITGAESGRTFGGNDGVITFALGKKLQDNISAGANVKIIRESVEDKNDVAYGADVGFLYKLSDLRLGISAQNLGTKIKLYEESFSLPLNFKFGLGYKFIKNADAGLDVNLPADNKIKTLIIFTILIIFITNPLKPALVCLCGHL